MIIGVVVCPGTRAVACAGRRASDQRAASRARVGVALGVGVAAALVSGSARADGPPPLDRAPTLFRDVNVVAMDDGPAVRDRFDVLVRDGRIEAVGQDLPAPDGARVVDGDGSAWLMPGLVDMHIHLPPQEGAAGDSTWRVLRLLAVHGVTTARSLQGAPAHPETRRRVREGELLGPTLYVSGPAIHDGNAVTPKQAEVLVREQHAAGFDLVKSHAISSVEAWASVQSTAKELGLATAGHLTNQVGLERALSAGQQIEHLDGFASELARDGVELPEFGQVPTPEAMELLDTAKIPGVAERIARAGVWSGPTLSLFEIILDPSRTVASLRARPEMRLVHDNAIEMWSQQKQGMAGAFPGQTGEAAIGLRRAMARALHGAGARLLACSDSPQVFHVPGVALHEELSSLESAGVPTLEVLRAATSNASDYLRGLPRAGSALGDAPDFGRIAPGQRADLLLLDADPTASVAHARRIRGVMLRGRWLDRGALDGIVAEVAESVGRGG